MDLKCNEESWILIRYELWWNKNVDFFFALEKNDDKHLTTKSSLGYDVLRTNANFFRVNLTTRLVIL